jgi:hypothetical protein
VEPAAWNDLHDWEVVSVLSEPLARRLTLSIAFPNARDPRDRAMLVFEGVVAHFLEGELHQNVIHEVRELPVLDVVRGYWFLFQRNRSFGWPSFIQASDEADLAQQLAAQGARAFTIDSSIGLGGFVLARSVDVHAVNPSA